jgi:hypothetical protein
VTGAGDFVLRSAATGDCLASDPAWVPWAVTLPCTGADTEIWDVEPGRYGYVLVNRDTRTCLTGWEPMESPLPEYRLWLEKCSGSPIQEFHADPA